MRILLTGSNGQLGYYLQKSLKRDGHDLLLTDGQSMDITNLNKTYTTITRLNPEIVIHAAAYTNVDQCEAFPDEAFRVNVLGTRNIAVTCNAIKAKLIYISTDFVFDGEKAEPYTEFDVPNPLNIYGKTKLAGEEYVKSLLNQYFIIRTSWLYGFQGENFVNTIAGIARAKGKLEVVDDQTGSPTFAGDLADVVSKLVNTDYYGTYHCSNEGACTWFEFAEKILELAGINLVEIKPISTQQLNRPAPRPKYSVLKNYMLELQNMQKMPYWQDALKGFLDGGVKCERDNPCRRNRVATLSSNKSN